jgi:hypothetical protein
VREEAAMTGDTLVDAVRIYVGGERALGFALTAVGALALAAIYFVWRTQPTSFAAGFAIPLVVFALGAGVGGAFLERRSTDQIARFSLEARERPAELVAAETARMTRVNANWPRIKLVWAALASIGFVLLLAVKRDGASGVGLALVLVAALLTSVDVFAERRARIYTAALGAQPR